MAEPGYANVGGKQVLICDIEEWLANRNLVAVPRGPTEAMRLAGHKATTSFFLRAKITCDEAWLVWSAMVAQAPPISIDPAEGKDSSRG